MDAKPSFIVLDIETTGVDPRKDVVHGVGIAFAEDDADYFSLDGLPVSLLEDPEVAKVGHNLRFDLKFLENAGVKVRGTIHDTMLLASLVDENGPLGLKELTERHFGQESLAGKSELDSLCQAAGVKHVGQLAAKDLADPSLGYGDVIARYCIEDCNNTWRLFMKLGQKLREIDGTWKRNFPTLKKGPVDYYKEEAQPLEHILLRMEQTGIMLDQARVEAARIEIQGQANEILEGLSETCSKEIGEIQDELYQEAVDKRVSERGKASVLRTSDKYGTAFSWSSNSHLARLFFDKLGCPDKLVSTTKSGQRSTAEADLIRIEQLLPGTKLATVLKAFGDYKKTQKFLTTYIGDSERGLLSHVSGGAIYARYHSGSGPVTGRLSSSDPNMQNLPRSGPVKKFFVPTPAHKFLYFDYSQVELRIAAHLSQDPELLNAYTKGLDLHRITASTIFGKDLKNVTDEERQVGKTFNFALIYDAAAYRLWQELSANGANYSVDDCERMRRAFFERYSVYKAFLGRVKSFVREHHAIISETGRVRRLPEIEFFDGLNWQTKTWQGPRHLSALLVQPGERISEEERFSRANKRAKHALKQAYNFPIQSLGASITKRAMIKLHEAGFKIVSQVHDAIIMEVHESKLDSWRFAQRILQDAYPLRVPLLADKKILNSLSEKDTIDISKPKEEPIVGSKGAEDESKPSKY